MLEFDEFSDSVRKTLKVTKAELSDERVQAFWAALDTDGSGYIEMEEFTKFMGRVKPIERKQMLMKQKSMSVRKDLEETQKKQIEDAGYKSSRPTSQMKAELLQKGIAVEDELEEKMLAITYCKWVKKFLPDMHQGIAWLTALREVVGSDGSGVLTFDHLRRMIRQKFKVPNSQFSEDKIMQLWCMIDKDESNSIQQVELGRFVKLAGPVKSDTAQFTFTNRVEAVRKGSLGPEDAKLLSVQLNQRVNEVMKDQGGDQDDWFALFKVIDNDSSGLLEYSELEQAIRGTLHFTEDELSVAKFKALWITLDEDDSGMVETAEFQRFMERREPADKIAKRQELLRQSSKKKRALYNKEKQKHIEDMMITSSKSTKEMKQELKSKGIPLADDLEAKGFAIQFAKWCKAYTPDSHFKIAWLKVFKELDDDDSGLLTYDSVRRAVRRTFKVGNAAFSEDKILQLWCYLDRDEADAIPQSDFARFMKLAGEVPFEKKKRFSLHEQLADPRKGGLEVEEANMLINKLNTKIDEILGNEAEGGWFTLFKEFDEDNSGLITFDELKAGIRVQLQIGPEELSNATLRAFWISLDEDDSGFVEQAEFHRFMKRTEPKTSDEARRDLIRQSSKIRRQEEEKKLQTYLEDEHLVSSITTEEMKKELAEANFPIPAEGSEERKNLAIQFCKWVKNYLPEVHHAIAWLQVFKEHDNGNSGLLTYDDIRTIIRHSFKVKQAVWSDLQIKAVWCMLDTDNSNSIARVEFGRFLKGHTQQGTATKQFSFSDKLVEARKGGLSKDDEKKVRALINSKIDKMYPGEANEKWFDLFKSIDEDCSGLLDQDEIKMGIREKMGISTEELSDAMFKAFWITLDEDDSGTVESAEFHRFLHREEPKGAIERRQEAMRASSKRKRAEMEKRQREDILDEGYRSRFKTSEMRAQLKAKGLDDLTEGEIYKIGKQYLAWVQDYLPDASQNIAWMKVFKEIATDVSGVITYDELRYAIRRTFKVPNSQFTEEKIMQLWCAVDRDNLDAIQQADWARLMKFASGIIKKFIPEERDDNISRMARGLGAKTEGGYVPKLTPLNSLSPPKGRMASPVKLTPVIPRIRPTTVPAKEKWFRPKGWNSFGWAPTSAETNFLGGPWSLKGHPFAGPAAALKTPARVLPASTQNTPRQRASPERVGVRSR